MIWRCRQQTNWNRRRWTACRTESKGNGQTNMTRLTTNIQRIDNPQAMSRMSKNKIRMNTKHSTLKNLIICVELLYTLDHVHCTVNVRLKLKVVYSMSHHNRFIKPPTKFKSSMSGYLNTAPFSYRFSTKIQYKKNNPLYGFLRCRTFTEPLFIGQCEWDRATANPERNIPKCHLQNPKRRA